MNPNEPQKSEKQSLARRLGWKKLAVTLVAAAIVLPIALITFGVVAIPVLAVPAVVVFGAGILVYALGRARHEALPDGER